MPFILLGWLLAVASAIWWPRADDDNPARGRAYRALRDAASCLVLGYVMFSILILLLVGVRPGDFLFLVVILALAQLCAFVFTPFALGMLALDFGYRWLGLGSSVLAALCGAGLTCYALLILLAAFTDPVPTWYAAPAFGAALLCGASTVFVLETYATMRAPGGEPLENPEAD
jgi:hypothetical protein